MDTNLFVHQALIWNIYYFSDYAKNVQLKFESAFEAEIYLTNHYELQNFQFYRPCTHHVKEHRNTLSSQRECRSALCNVADH